MDLKKVLIVDDDRDYLEELSTALEFEGFKVLTLLDSVDILEAVKDFKPDVILLDLHMYSIDGFRTAAALKDNPYTKHIPILSMSSYYKPSDHWFVSFDNFEECLTKGADAKNIATELRRVIARRRPKNSNSG